MKKFIIAIILIGSTGVLVSFLGTNAVSGYKDPEVLIDSVSRKVDSLLNLMTLEEKIGQMNQYNGFWDVTGPVPSGGDAAKKYEDLRKGLVGSMINVHGVKNVKAVQKIA
ncbi:MAG TPA: glycosyl hydrolase, partial [Aquaticitalea sp.]|nr:glycosyl hydrolase [Aquaticitalea sp.]